MRNLIILSGALFVTGCATVPQQQTPDNVAKQEVQKEHAKTLVKSLLVLGAVLYVANEVADSNRKKQCSNNELIYTGTGNKRLYLCP